MRAELGKVSQELRARFDTGAYLFGIIERDGAWGHTWVIVKAASVEEGRKKVADKYPNWDIKKEHHLMDMFELPGGNWRKD